MTIMLGTSKFGSKPSESTTFRLMSLMLRLARSLKKPLRITIPSPSTQHHSNQMLKMQSKTSHCHASLRLDLTLETKVATTNLTQHPPRSLIAAGTMRSCKLLLMYSRIFGKCAACKRPSMLFT
jgi:hypothetical protein